MKKNKYVNKKIWSGHTSVNATELQSITILIKYETESNKHK